MTTRTRDTRLERTPEAQGFAVAFGERLQRVKELLGMTWDQLAEAVIPGSGPIKTKQINLWKWRQGLTQPPGIVVQRLYELASPHLGGLEILLGYDEKK